MTQDNENYTSKFNNNGIKQYLDFESERDNKIEKQSQENWEETIKTKTGSSLSK